MFAFPLGILADRIGLKTVFTGGLLIFAAVYLGTAFNKNLYCFFGLFFLYGIYASATEGVAKAWISNITDGKDIATAIGTFSGFQGICTMAGELVVRIYLVLRRSKRGPGHYGGDHGVDCFLLFYHPCSGRTRELTSEFHILLS